MALNFYSVTSVARHGCVFAPTLFTTCMDWIMGSHYGAIRRNIKVTDLDFVNDVAILSQSLESLDAFSNEAKPLG